MPPTFTMKKGQFALKQGALTLHNVKMNFKKQPSGKVLLTIQAQITPDQIAEDHPADTDIKPSLIPCGVFSFNEEQNKNGFPQLAIRSNNGSNAMSIIGGAFSILTDGDKREHGVGAPLGTLGNQMTPS